MSETQKQPFSEPRLTQEASLVNITLVSGEAGTPIRPHHG
jgi:hypothetical protein